MNKTVSVPIRGLFNLTYISCVANLETWLHKGFRPHQGII